MYSSLGTLLLPYKVLCKYLLLSSQWAKHCSGDGGHSNHEREAPVLTELISREEEAFLASNPCLSRACS